MIELAYVSTYNQGKFATPTMVELVVQDGDHMTWRDKIPDAKP